MRFYFLLRVTTEEKINFSFHTWFEKLFIIVRCQSWQRIRGNEPNQEDRRKASRAQRSVTHGCEEIPEHKEFGRTRTLPWSYRAICGTRSSPSWAPASCFVGVYWGVFPQMGLGEWSGLVETWIQLSKNRPWQKTSTSDWTVAWRTQPRQHRTGSRTTLWMSPYMSGDTWICY